MIKKFVLSSKKEKSTLSGFTLAEILITLSIIGIVAAITIPSLMANVQEKAWAAQKKALAARMSQTFPQLSKLNGYGIGTDGTIDKANAAQIFITEGLSKVYKIASVCSKDNISSCGIPSQITTLGGTKQYTFPKSFAELNKILTSSVKDENNKDRNTLENGGIIEDTDVAAFETMNGESIALFYNPKCKQISSVITNKYAQSEVCANLIYDLNGTKAPNEVGKDIGFITVFSSTDPVVAAPVPVLPFYDKGKSMYGESGNDAISYCKSQDTNSRLPDMYEGYSMFLNDQLLGYTTEGFGDYWTGTPISGVGKDGYTVVICSHVGQYLKRKNSDTASTLVRCVEK